VHEQLPSETDNTLSGSIISCLLGSVYQALFSNELFQLVFLETCFNKPFSSNKLIRHKNNDDDDDD
jgi:hypothetical protein